MGNQNIKLTLAYDGTNFSGFQRQKNTHETIQEKLETALSSLTGENITLFGAGRTDAGVHATGQVVNFRTNSSIPADRWGLALRGHLPKEIVVYKSEEVSKAFHARYSAISKTYVYWIWREMWPSIFNQRYTLHYSGILDEKAIESAIPLLIGKHDFNCFASKGTEVKETVRTVSRLELEKNEDSWRFWIKADGFLYHMVRNIVGTLLWVGEKKLSCSEIERALLGDIDIKLGPTVSARGLCLRKVNY